MDKDEKELQFLSDAVLAGRQARDTLIKRAASSGKVVDFTKLRQLDMDIRQCETEIRRSECR